MQTSTSFPLQLAWALRRTFKNGYSQKSFFSDLKAGVTVGVVAIPLAMALGIASGMTPQAGLYTAIVAGFLIALLGGSKFQVSGPTAAFVVLLVPVVNKFGPSGLMVASLLAGLILIAFSLLRLAEVIQFIPHPVTTGFTSGIAVVIAVIQMKDFFGLTYTEVPENFFQRLAILLRELPNLSLFETATATLTLTILVMSFRYIRRLPAPVVALGVVTTLTTLLEWISPSFQVRTIATVFGGIPRELPSFVIPWNMQTPGAAPFEFNMAHILDLMPYAFSIAMLGAIESLLTAVVADGATGKRHNPNGELLAQGIGNVVSPFFGGFAATGAVARTVTNIRFGAVSPVSAMIHAVTVLAALMLLAPVIDRVPMASLAAVLVFVAWNMAEKKHFKNILLLASRDDKFVLVACFLLTVFFDMTVGVGVGTGLAALLFIRRVAQLVQSDVIRPGGEEDVYSQKLPKDIFVYRISGPLFFGAAQRAMATLRRSSHPDVRKVIIDLSAVQLMDSTGIVAFESVLLGYLEAGHQVVVVTTNPNIRRALKESGEAALSTDRFRVAASVKEALT